jgi:hypothetical protein
MSLKKLTGFFDKDMLQLFEFELLLFDHVFHVIWKRSNGFTLETMIASVESLMALSGFLARMISRKAGNFLRSCSMGRRLIPFGEIGFQLRGWPSNGAGGFYAGFFARLYLDLAARLIYVAGPGRMNSVWGNPHGEARGGV